MSQNDVASQVARGLELDRQRQSCSCMLFVLLLVAAGLIFTYVEPTVGVAAGVGACLVVGWFHNKQYR